MNLFAYGSLMIPAVTRAVTGKDFPFCKALLQDYARFKVKGESYPGIAYRKGMVTHGVVYLGVDDLSFERLDAFEGEMYSRVSVAVETVESGVLPAETYGIKPPYQHFLSSDPWNLEEFERNHLGAFMKGYKGFSVI